MKHCRECPNTFSEDWAGDLCPKCCGKKMAEEHLKGLDKILSTTSIPPSGRFSSVPCCECGKEVQEFTVPNVLWNMVMRPDEHETNKEYICYSCWNLKLLEYINRIKAQGRKFLDVLTYIKRAHETAGHTLNIEYRKVRRVIDGRNWRLFK